MSNPKSCSVAIGLGANLGDPPAAIRTAVRLLAAGGLAEARISPFFETAPVDCVPGTPRFVNAAVVGRWSGSLTALLRLCKAIEQCLGRPPEHSSQEARVIDLDILLFGDRRTASAAVRVPHPRLISRRFALAPLACLAPDWPIPGTTLTVAAALARLGKDAEADRIRRLPDGEV